MKLNLNCQMVGKFMLLALFLFTAVTFAEAKGNKYGLFVGINDYPEPINKLSGCINDVQNMRNMLVTQFAFKKPNTTILTDAQATREGIIAQIKAYEKKASAGDLFVFHYSGHGTLFPDSYSEEQDETVEQYLAVKENGKTVVMYPRATYDSAIVPVDVSSNTSGKSWANLILDDELYALFSAFTNKGVQVVFISDSCHSGSVARAGETNIPVRFVPLYKALNVKSFDELDLKKPETTTKVVAPPQLNKLYLALTGSKDDEFSLDGGGGGERMGLFTSTLLKTLTAKNSTDFTYDKLMAAVSSKVSAIALKLNKDQNPQLDTRFGNGGTKIFSLPAPVSPKANK